MKIIYTKIKIQFKLIVFIISILTFGTLSLAQVPTNKYVRLEDASGFNTNPYQEDLEKNAAELVAALPSELRDSFRVYSGGTYIFHSKLYNGVNKGVEFIENKASNMSKYYLIFIKETDSLGLYRGFRVSMKLPKWGVFSCIDKNEYNLLESQVDYSVKHTYNLRNKHPLYYYLAEDAGMKKLKEKVERLVRCCQQGTINSTLADCSFAENDILAYLQTAGFSEINGQKIFRLQVANHQGDFISPFNLILKNEEDTTKAYYYTDTLRNLLAELKEIGEVKGRLTYFSASNVNDFKNFRPLILGNQVFIQDIVLLRFGKKIRMFVYLERKENINNEGRSGIVDTKKLDKFFTTNESLSCINTLGKHINLEKYAIDGHYGTVYLVAKLMGISNNTSEQLAIKAEWFDHIVDPGTETYRIQPSQYLPCNPNTT